MKKPSQRYWAFSDRWFSKHQKTLIALLNGQITRRWFRWVLRIRPYDCPLTKLIVKITPISFTMEPVSMRKKYITHPRGLLLYDKTKRLHRRWLKRYGYRLPLLAYYKMDIRTHAKFSKRLYFAFRPLWWTMHFWDVIFADRFMPQLSFGFLTLTAYPDAGNPGTNTVDGLTYKADAVYATARNAATGNVLATNAFTTFSDNSTAAGVFETGRPVATFDTSALGGSAIISATVISWFGHDPAPTAFNDDTNCYSVVLANNNQLVAADYAIANYGTTQFATSINYAAWDTTGYNPYTLNASGISNINKTGISAFSFRSVKEVAGTSPDGDTYISSYYADAAGTANDPKLVVTYTISGNDKMFLLFE